MSLRLHPVQSGPSRISECGPCVHQMRNFMCRVREMAAACSGLGENPEHAAALRGATDQAVRALVLVAEVVVLALGAVRS